MSCLRCSDPAFEAAMSGWLSTFVEHVRPFFASRGGPVAMIQIENELGCGNGSYTNWAIDTAVKLDTGIPWSFCNNSVSTQAIILGSIKRRDVFLKDCL